MAGGAVAALLYKWVFGRKWERTHAQREGDLELAVDAPIPDEPAKENEPHPGGVGADAEMTTEQVASNGSSTNEPHLGSRARAIAQRLNTIPSSVP